MSHILNVYSEDLVNRLDMMVKDNIKLKRIL